MLALADRREIYVAVMPYEVRVISRSSGVGRFMQILARQNCIGIEWLVAITTEAGLMYVNASDPGRHGRAQPLILKLLQHGSE
jgi:hypothetical protein